MRNLSITAMLVFIAFGPFASAQSNMDPATTSALKKTQNLLTTPSERDKYAKKHPKAAAAEARVNDLVQSPAQREQLYKIAAQVFGTKVHATNGNSPDQAKKLQEMMQKAMQNPKAFYDSLTPSEKAEIEKLGNQINTSDNQVGQHP